MPVRHKPSGKLLPALWVAQSAARYSLSFIGPLERLAFLLVAASLSLSLLLLSLLLLLLAPELPADLLLLLSSSLLPLRLRFLERFFLSSFLRFCSHKSTQTPGMGA
jgi:hypothetical protein